MMAVSNNSNNTLYCQQATNALRRDLKHPPLLRCDNGVITLAIEPGLSKSFSASLICDKTDAGNVKMEIKNLKEEARNWEMEPGNWNMEPGS